MSGPTAKILTKDIITENQKYSIKKYIQNKAPIIKGDDFWINGDPFFIQFGEKYENEIQEYIDERFIETVGWEPKDILTIVAMCSQQKDYEILRELCNDILQIVDGFIDF